MKTSKMMIKTCPPVIMMIPRVIEEEPTEYEGGSSGDDYVERSFQVLFIDEVV